MCIAAALGTIGLAGISFSRYCVMRLDSPYPHSDVTQLLLAWNQPTSEDIRIVSCHFLDKGRN